MVLVKAILAGLIVSSLILAGCTAPRDIDQEGADRAKWAEKNDRYDVVAVLSGPERIQPGALVWFSAYGSHDPDFVGATTRDLYQDDPQASGGVLYTDEVNNIHFNWYVPLETGQNRDLGTGIRIYEWQINEGPVLRSFDLTHRYGSEDGPIRFPVGFTATGEHDIQLTVIGWDGSRDKQTARVTVADGGIESTVAGWHATEGGWVHERSADIALHAYGECPPLSPTGYDAPTHHVRAPWDLVYYMERVRVEATWAAATEALPVPIPDALALNTNQVDITLGHCERENAWARFSADQEVIGETPHLSGEVLGDDFATNLEAEGKRSEKHGAWDFNAYMSDRGQRQGGSGTTVDIQFIFVPARDTASGGI